jgi:transglutaminase-like putative cysteine protease
MQAKTAPALPRETRDTLLILGSVGLVLLPQVAYLPVWASALALCMLAWRLWMARQGQNLPGKWLLAALLALAIGATVLQFRSIVGPEAGVVLVVLLLVLKTLEMRARRDAMVIFFLGFFTLLTLFLQSQSLSMAVAMLLAVWGLLAAVVNAHMPAGYPSLRQLLSTSGLLMLLGAPIMLVLFLSFPRFAPLWGLPVQPNQGSTGLSNDMTVGQVAELAQNRSVALRVRFDPPGQQPPPQRLLYFRGPVLSHFDGRHWSSSPDAWQTTLAPNSTLPASGLGNATGYEITLEPHQQRWLLTLDATVAQPEAAVRRLLPTTDLQWLTTRPITEVLRYQGQAYLHYAYGQQLSSYQRNRHLQLPQALNPRTATWAQELRAQHGHDDTAIIQAALTHLANGGYTYTLQPGVSTSAHTADEFWFDSQQGFCEHIASAFVVLMRAAGIPARIVTGYQGGERNPVDGLWTVRQSDAHAWTEVWLPNEGWMRIDPTAAVAPSRTEQLQRLAAPSTLLESTVDNVISPAVLQRLRANWEAVNHRWNDWVLNYSRSNQNNLLRNLRLEHWKVTDIAVWLCAIALTVLLGFGVQRWRVQRMADPWLRLMGQARQQLLQAGITHASHLGPRGLAQAAQAQWGDESRPLQQWLLQMEQSRYAPHSAQTPSLAALRRSYRALIWPRPRTP